MVKYLAMYVAVGWFSTEIAFFTACRPFVGYWAMPPPNPQCTTLQHYAIVQACFNISSDTLMLLIPLPLITRMNAPWRQKAILMVIFSMGIFVILAAILTKVFNLSNIWDPSYMLWYTREASVAVYVSNLPMIWPLLREWFPYLKALTPGQKSSSAKVAGYGSSGHIRITTSNGRDLKSKRFSHNGVTTTIHGKGESTEDLSSSDGTEMKAIVREDSWEQQRPSTSQGDISLVGGGWESQREIQEMKDGGITMTTTVQMVEEQVNPRTTRPVAVSSTDGDLEKGHAGFKWDFERDHARK
jgi:hypothetical protein